MQSQQIRVTLHSTITGKDSSDPADVILQKIQQIKQSVAQLRDENLERERVRDQYIIHLQQCQEDHNIIREIQKKLKLRLDLALQDAQPEAVPLTQVPPAGNPVKPVPVQQTSDVKPVVARRMPTLENIKPSVKIQAHDKYPAESVRLRYALNTSSVICSGQFSPDGSLIAFADGNFVYIVMSSDGEIVCTIERPPAEHTRVLKWSPDGQYVALGGPQNEVLLYDVKTRKLVHSFEGHEGEVSAIAFNSDGSWLISGGFDGVIFVWDMATYKQLKNRPHKNGDKPDTIMDIATTPEADTYAVGFSRGIIGIHDGTFEEPMMSFWAHQNLLMALAVTTYGGYKTVASVSHDHTAKVWEMKSVARCKYTLEGHQDCVVSVAFSPIGPLMITGSKDQTFRMWQYKDGKALFTVTPDANTLFEIDHHPTQRTFVTFGGDGVVCVWDYDELD